MRFTQLILLSIFYLQTYVSGYKGPEYALKYLNKNGIIELGKKDYDSFSSGVEGHYALVFFTMPDSPTRQGNCEVCDEFQITFNSVAKKIRKLDPNAKIFFYSINAMDSLQIIQDFQLTYLPHVYLFGPPSSKLALWKNEEYVKYELNIEIAAEEQDLIDFLKRNTNGALDTVNDINIKELGEAEFKEDSEVNEKPKFKKSINISEPKKTAKKSAKKLLKNADKKDVEEFVSKNTEDAEDYGVKSTIPSVGKPVESFKVENASKSATSCLSKFTIPDVGEPQQPKKKHGNRNVADPLIKRDQEEKQQQQEQEQEQESDFQKQGKGIGLQYKADNKPMGLTHLQMLLEVGQYFQTIIIAIAIYFIFDKFILTIFS